MFEENMLKSYIFDFLFQCVVDFSCYEGNPKQRIDEPIFENDDVCVFF